VVGFLPAGGISWRQLSAILRYIPEDHVRAMATQLSAAGVLNVNDDGIGFSDEGRRSAQAVINVLPAALHELWNVDVDRLDALLSLAQPIAAVATADAMTSPKVVDAILRPTASTTSFELWHALAKIRRHRADAHAAAWSHAAHTADSIQRLGPGPERDAIEQHTNELNSPIWSAIDATDRTRLLAGLAGLNGIGDPT